MMISNAACLGFAGLAFSVAMLSASVSRAAEGDDRLAWFRDARFGLFIHWGIYSVPAGEWEGKNDYGEWIMEQAKIPASRYERLAGDFKPVKFDARAWARAAKDAGMKYVVITSKHHDGFCMFDTTQTNYNVVKASSWHHDPMKDLAEACKEEGLTLCFYHSIMDWHHPDYEPRRPWNDLAKGEPDLDRYVAYMKAQLKELCSHYGPIGILWFDGSWEKSWTPERGRDLYQYVRSLQPNIIVNDRVGKHVGAHADTSARIGDYGTPEQEIPANGLPGVDWETCMTMNDHWGYNKHDDHWKSTTELVRNLIDIASKGGNYLLNVGPTSEGLIPEASLTRMREIGAWMKTNGQAIYGTSAGPFRRQLGWGRCTQKNRQLYLHVFDWPSDGRLSVPLRNAARKSYLLADPSKALSTHASENGLTIDVPQSAPDQIASVVVLDIDGAPDVITPPPPAQAADGSVTLRAADAEIIGTARLETHDGQLNIGYWTNHDDHAIWEFQLNQPGEYAVELNYSRAPESPGGELRIEAGDQHLAATLDFTKTWSDFKQMKIGRLRLDKPGLVRLTVRPNKLPGAAVINLRTLVLRPGPK